MLLGLIHDDTCRPDFEKLEWRYLCKTQLKGKQVITWSGCWLASIFLAPFAMVILSGSVPKFTNRDGHRAPSTPKSRVCESEFTMWRSLEDRLSRIPMGSLAPWCIQMAVAYSCLGFAWLKWFLIEHLKKKAAEILPKLSESFRHPSTCHEKNPQKTIQILRVLTIN